MENNILGNLLSPGEHKELFKALVQFHANLKQPSKNAKNPFLKNDYVNLEGVEKTVEDACKGTGLTFAQLPLDSPNGQCSVITIIMHISGEYLMSGALTLTPQKKDPQGYGSAITYAKRYQLASMFGISSELDDDGNASSITGQNRNRQNSRQTRQAPQSQRVQQPNSSQQGNNQTQQMVINNLKSQYQQAVSEYAVLTQTQVSEANKQISSVLKADQSYQALNDEIAKINKATNVVKIMIEKAKNGGNN